MRIRACFALVPLLSALAAPAAAQTYTQIGVLSCDVSPGIGLILVQKQTMVCAFTPSGGGPLQRYVGSVTEYGIELGQVARGHLVWGVIAATQGVPIGALAGSYTGVSAGAAVGAGGSVGVLVGGTGRAFSLQPVSVEGEIGINLAAGIRTIELRPAL